MRPRAGGVSPAGGNLPAELQNFVLERARETAALKEQLGMLRAGTQQADRQWGALTEEQWTPASSCGTPC